MKNSANTITQDFAPVMTLVKKSTTKKSANDNRIRIHTLVPNFNYINNKGETVYYTPIKI